MKKFKVNVREVENSRLIAIRALIQISDSKSYANLFLPTFLSEKQVRSEDRAFITEIVYGSLRLQGWYDYLISKLADRDIKKIDGRTLICLRVGAHQILSMKVENYAAVNETVSAAKELLGQARASFVNALLRKLTQIDLKEIETELEKMNVVSHLSIKYSHPEWIVSAYFDVLKDTNDVIKLLNENNISAKPDYVCLPTKARLEEVQKAYKIQKVFGLENGFTCDEIPTEVSFVKERKVTVQDRASQKIVELILNDYKPALNWLDMCAGPGGKAAYLYHSLLNLESKPSFLATEVSAHRVDLVSQVIPANLVRQQDGREIGDLSPSTFDRIILDAPCTGLGALRRRPDARWTKSVNDLKDLILLQRQLLASAAKAIKESGSIYYITCSPHKAETDLMISEFLIDHSNFKLEQIGKTEPTDLKSDLQSKYFRTWTHLGQGDSMFMAKLTRVS